MDISRRDALLGATAAAAVTGLAVAPLAIKAAGVKAALAGPDLLREGVQALVGEIRQGLGGRIPLASIWALHQAADRLEALPGIQAVSNAYWDDWRKVVGRRGFPTPVLQLTGRPQS